jgi:hypothetical protein
MVVQRRDERLIARVFIPFVTLEAGVFETLLSKNQPNEIGLFGGLRGEIPTLCKFLYEIWVWNHL